MPRLQSTIWAKTLAFDFEAKNLTYLLNKREKKALAYIKNLYESRYGQKAESDCDLVAFLGDNPQNFLCWSAASKRVPTLRMNNGKLFIVAKKRWFHACIKKR